MKKLLPFLLLLCASSVRANEFDDTYGVGVLHVDLTVISDLKFYPTWSPEKIAEDLKFETSNVDKKGKTKTSKLLSGNEKKWLEPEAFDPANMVFTMRVMEKKSGWFSVMVNNRTRQTYWVRAANGLGFNTWNDEIEFCLGVARTSKGENPLRKAPSSNFTLVWDEKLPECFKVEAVQGYWVRVSMKKDCPEGAQKFDEAWFKWRDEKDLFVSYQPAPVIEKK